ncbi:MAG: Ig-like domain-containing protein [Nanobdellota archaeon]
MAKGYEYHKRNDYPGERVDEKKRVAKREEKAENKADERVAEKGKADQMNANARVARKGRRDQKLMDSEKKSNAAEAARVRKKRDSGDMIAMAVIAGLAVILVIGAIWGITAMQRQSNEIDYLNSALSESGNSPDSNQLSPREVCENTNTEKILYMSPMTSVSPANNKENVSVDTSITATFSQDMDPSTINEDTFIVEQRTTPNQGSDADQYRSTQIEGTVTYNDRKAIFTPEESLYPNHKYGNVFTATITDEVEDTKGNSLQKDYIWSFTTGHNVFVTGNTTSHTG